MLSKAVYNKPAQLYVTFYMVVTAVASSRSEVCSRRTGDAVCLDNDFCKVKQNLSPALYLNPSKAGNTKEFPPVAKHKNIFVIFSHISFLISHVQM